MKKRNKKQLLLFTLIAIAILAPLVAKAFFIEAIAANAVSAVLSFIIVFVVWILGMLFALAVDVFIILIQLNPQSLASFAAQIDYVWIIVRDLCNMLFIIIMLVVAFGTILRVESYKWNKVLPKIIMVAILINFSKTIALIIIDASQVLMMTFVYAFRDIAAGNLAEGFNLTRLLSQTGSNMTNSGGGSFLYGGFKALLPLVLAIVLIAIAILVLLVLAVLLLVRIIVLWVLVAVSPIAYLGQILDATKKYSKMWWDNLIKYAMLGPALAFFLWFAFLFVGHNPIKNEDALPRDTPEEVRKGITYDYFGSDASDPISFLNFTVTIILLLVGTNIAIKSGGLGAKAAGAVWNGGKQMGKNFLAKGAGMGTLGKGISMLGGGLAGKGGIAGGIGKGLQGLGLGVGKFGKLAAAPIVLPGMYDVWRKKKARDAIKAGEDMFGGESFFNTYLSLKGLGAKAKARGLRGLIAGKPFTAERAKNKEDEELADQEEDLQEQLDNEPGQRGKDATIEELREELEKKIKQSKKETEKNVLNAILAAYNDKATMKKNENDFRDELWKEKGIVDPTGAIDRGRVSELEKDEDYMRKFNEDLFDKIKTTDEYRDSDSKLKTNVYEAQKTGDTNLAHTIESGNDEIGRVQTDTDLSKYVEKGRRILEQEIAELQAKRYAIRMGIAVDDDVEKVDKAVQNLIKRQEEILKGAHEKLKMPGATLTDVADLQAELGKVHSQLDNLGVDPNLKINWNRTINRFPLVDKDKRAKELNNELERVNSTQETITTQKKLRDEIIKNVTTKEATVVRPDGDINQILAYNTTKNDLQVAVDTSRYDATSRKAEAEWELSRTTNPTDIAYWKKEIEQAESDYKRADSLYNSLSTYNATDEIAYQNSHRIKQESDFASTDEYQNYIKSLGFTDKNSNADMDGWEKHWLEREGKKDSTGHIIAGKEGEYLKETERKSKVKQKFVDSPPSALEIENLKKELKNTKEQRKAIGEWRESVKTEAELSKKANIMSGVSEALDKLKDVEPENLVAHFKDAMKGLGNPSKASAVAIKLAQNGDFDALLKEFGYKVNHQGVCDFVNTELIRNLGMDNQQAYVIQSALDDANKQYNLNLSFTTAIEGGRVRQTTRTEHDKRVLNQGLKAGSISGAFSKLGSSLGVEGPGDTYEPGDIAKLLFILGKNQSEDELIRSVNNIAPNILKKLYQYSQTQDRQFFNNLKLSNKVQQEIRRIATSVEDTESIIRGLNSV